MIAARGAVVWVAAFGAVALGLAGLDRVPRWVAAWRGEVPCRFATPTEVENAFGVRLGWPFYVPDFLEWPPSLLLARRRPLAIYAEIRRRDAAPGDPPALVIRQWRKGSVSFRAAAPLSPGRSGELPLRGGGSAPFIEGRDERGQTAFRVEVAGRAVWTEVTARLGWQDFVRMVGSLGP